MCSFITHTFSVILVTVLLAALVIAPLSSLHHQAYANWMPIGQPDIDILMTNPSFSPIELTEDNYDILLEDIAMLPSFLNATMMPHVRDVFIANNATLHNQYIQSILVAYNMETDIMRIDIASAPNDFKEQTFNMSGSSIPKMSLIQNLAITMPVRWNYTYEHVGMHLTVMHRLEEFNIDRSEILADHAIGAFVANKYNILSPDEQPLRRDNSSAPVPITYINLQMLSYEIARAVAMYAMEGGATSVNKKVFDEIRPTGYIVVTD